MKNATKFLLIASITFSTDAFAQPVILNGNNIPAPGTTAPLFAGVAAGIGNPGINQVWDFSAVTFNATPLTWTVVTPASTPYFSSFPTANYAWTFTSTSPSRYFYFNVSSSKFDVLADNLLTPGTGNDFTPNPKTSIRFPFLYTDTVQDTYQKVGGSTTNVLTEYDGYGTLITPFATYTNVWRVKEDVGGGNGTYTWEFENPLQPLLVYTISNNSLTLFGNAPLYVKDANALNVSVNVYPNPAKNKFIIQVSDIPANGHLKLDLLNVAGQVVKQIPINTKSTPFECDNIPSGIYFYQLNDGKNLLEAGKIVVE